jgi:Na+(H+)/acetate symporter ActP
MQFVGSDAGELMNLFTSHASNEVTVTSSTVKIILLLLPVVLTMLFMIKTVRGGGKLTLNVLPAIGVGLVGALLIIPALPPGLSHSIQNSDIWAQVGKAQDLIVGATGLICLFVLWLQRPKTGDDKHGKHGH